ncbi:hypothetical protein BN1110_05308 [bacterium YEK0313]|nr:hypothetical protein BN1110_05308 [bacterium YEK0313]
METHPVKRSTGLVLLLLAAAAAGGYYWWANHAAPQAPGVTAGVPDGWPGEWRLSSIGLHADDVTVSGKGSASGRTCLGQPWRRGAAG